MANTNIKDLEYRYLNDPEFHHMVKSFYHFFMESKLTITEVKDALLLAAILHERDNIRPIIMDNEEVKFKEG